MNEWNPEAHDIFLEAIEHDSAEQRRLYLDDACGENADLRAEVESLLEADIQVGSFLERPLVELGPAAPDETQNDSSEDSLGDKEEVSLDFLEPCGKPDCLGRLGQYEITEVVGRGGMGIVLKGNDPKLNRVVAVKVLAPELASNASACKRFLREGRAAAAVSHDHVVTVYGIDDGGRLPFIAMEYISGPSLEGRIKREGTLELTEILRIGMQIASGLAAAHAQGLVHRDVKPANILLENGVEKVKITDFGLARAVDDVRVTKPGMVTGTPEYMSPEQARGESVDHRTDLFSLGSVMYAMCTGRSPFRAENTPAMIRRVCDDTPRPIEDVNPEIPGWLIQIIEELLVKPAADRFQSAAELAELLGQCLAHLQEPSVNPLPDRLEGRKFSRFARRRAMMRRRGWLAAAAAVLLVALGGLSLTEATGLTDVAGTVIRIVRGDGTLVIHVDDPEVSVSIDGEQLVITGAGAREIRLGVGQHELRAVKDGKSILIESVTITRDGKRVVEVNAEALASAEVAETAESEEPAGVELQEVWSFSGLDDLAVRAISRDGRYCAFIDSETGDLMVRDLTTGEDRRLTEPTAGRGIGRASISPDKKWVAYVEHNGREWYELRIVGIDGSGERVLYVNEEESKEVFLSGWDPESQYLLATFCDTGGDVPISGPKAYRIATVSVADGSIKVLKKVTERNIGYRTPRFSPDGRYVAYDRSVDGQRDVFLVPLDGGKEIHLIDNPTHDSVLGWIPDSQYFLFTSDRGGKGLRAWMIRVVDGKPERVPRLVTRVQLANRRTVAQGPVRTPTGGWAFYHRESGQAELMHSSYLASLDPDTGKILTAPKPISQPSAERELVQSPDFSRDGKYLAYYVAPAPKKRRYGPGNIVIRTLETGQEREITLSPKLSCSGRLGHLSWAPDGRSIFVCGRAETGRHGIYQVDINTGNLDPVVLEAPEQTSTDWQLHLNFDNVEGEHVLWGEPSADGKTLFFPRHHFDPNAKQFITQCRIVARDLETDEEREIYRNPDGVFKGLFCGVSPDGEHVFVASGTMLKIFPTAGGEPRELLEFEGEVLQNVPSTMTWMADSRHLLFVRTTQGRAELWRISAEGGEPERLGEVPAVFDSNVSCLRMHPDGRQIAFARHRWHRQSRIQMMQIVVSGELAKEMCTANLTRIGEAIEQYKNDHADVPNWLSDLYPDYLQDTHLLLCPADRSGGIAGAKDRFAGPKDPETLCSYAYMFHPGMQWVYEFMFAALPVDFPAREGMTWKDARKLQLEYFGPVVPIVQCWHHSPQILLDYDGDICEAESDWALSPRAGAGLLSQLKAAMKTEPGTWAQRYDTQRFLRLLRLAAGDEAALAKLLETHLEEHPDDEAAREFLAELPRLRFCGDGSLEEVDDGSVELGPIDLELGEKVVGIWFPDISVPQGARVKRAYVQFTAQLERPSSEKTDLVLRAELAPNADSCKKAKHNITSRRKTAASVKWSPEPWTVPCERSQRQRTPDLSSLIQEVVNQPDWQKGNALVLVISGSGRRRAQPHEDWSGAPMLYVEH